MKYKKLDWEEKTYRRNAESTDRSQIPVAILVKKNTQAARNSAKFWERVMVSNKELIVVEVYRAK
jgi:hypothetical protein